jgi:hypothetical protein
MKPISSTLPMSFPLFFIILFPNWFLWSYLFNSANVWRGLHVAYLLGSSPLLNFVTPMMASGSLASPLALFPLPSFFVRCFKQGCSTSRCAPKMKVCLGGFWYPLLMFHFFCFVASPFFQALGNSLSFFTPPLWEFLKDFWIWSLWNTLKPI